MKKHWSLLLGASLITGIASSIFLKTKQGTIQSKNDATTLANQYIGNWWFINHRKKTQHSLKIDASFNIKIDNRQIPLKLIELSNSKLVVQDEYGYHLIIQCIDEQPISLYDEADDVTYKLEQHT